MTPTVTRQDVSLELALTLLEGVRQEAARQGQALAVAVVDSSGLVVASVRMDGAQVVALPLAVDKAYTAVGCGMATDVWGERTQPGGPDWGFSTTLGGRIVVFAGGVPIRVEGALVGGLGVSGGPAAADKQCALAGLARAGLTLAD